VLPLRWRVRAAASAAVIPPLVSCVSFSRLATWLGRDPARRPGGGLTDPVDDAALARWVDRVLRALPGPWRYTCLRRAAVLYYLLRRAGRPVELWLGVRRDDAGALGAHAWLVSEGQPYLEPEPHQPARHKVIARFPEARAVPL
jgi:transglutaminase superfamily protein